MEILLNFFEEILIKKNNQVVMSFFSPSGYDNYNFDNENFHKFYFC